ncbi:hypothetical protein J4226_04905 [Candidatus Pacearchaeota archaeon]|nr:hypothetical protein [Candidatus Pacearchaeota archaeon]
MESYEIREIIEKASSVYRSRGMSGIEDLAKKYNGSEEGVYVKKIIENVRGVVYHGGRFFGEFPSDLQDKIFDELIQG